MTGSRLLHTIERVATGLSLVAGLAVVGLSVLIGFDMVARRLLGFSLQGSDEIGGYTLALVGSLGLSYTLLQRGHPRIDILLRCVPVAARAALHGIAYLCLSGFAVFMVVHAYRELGLSLRFQAVANTPLQTPLWIPQSLWVLGIGFFALTAIVCAAHSILTLCRDPALADRLYGTRTAADEVRDYIRNTPPGDRA